MNDQTQQSTAGEPAAEQSTDASASTPPEASTALVETLEQAQARADSAREQLLRAHAEMENLRRRYERELQNAIRYGIEGLVADLLPVRDSLQEGLKAAEVEGIDAATALEKIIEGTRMTLGILDKALSKAGLVQINPQGEPFNPELHQALSLVDASQLPPNHVVQVVQTGYRLHDRLVRPAMVIVSK